MKEGVVKERTEKNKRQEISALNRGDSLCLGTERGCERIDMLGINSDGE